MSECYPWSIRASRTLCASPRGFDVDSLTEEDDTEDGDLPHEYLKTQLCECEGREEARQIGNTAASGNRELDGRFRVSGLGRHGQSRILVAPNSSSRRARLPHSDSAGNRRAIQMQVPDTSLLCVQLRPRTYSRRRRSCEFVALREMREAVDRSIEDQKDSPGSKTNRQWRLMSPSPPSHLPPYSNPCGRSFAGDCAIPFDVAKRGRCGDACGCAGDEGFVFRTSLFPFPA